MNKRPYPGVYARHLALLSLLACLVVTSHVAADGGWPARIEQAVVTGNVSELESIRESLFETGPGAANDYLRAYANWRICQLLPRKDRQRKARLKEAETSLDQAIAQDPGNPEYHALRASVLGDRISGTFSGIKLGPKASASADRAVELGPDNPRAALSRGTGYYFTPKTFGGGLERALEELQRAVELFASQAPKKSWPNWGQVDALGWYGQALLDSGELELARESFEAALALSPGHAWVVNSLLPQLDR